MANGQPQTAANSSGGRPSVAEALDWLPLMQSYAATELAPAPLPLSQSPEDAARFVALYETFAASQSLDDYDMVHAVRFRGTASLFGSYLEASRRVVELGGHSRIGVFAESAFGVDYQSYGAELRDQFDLDDNAFDCVLCLEVIEHLKDTHVSENSIERIASFNYSGIMNLLSESFRILKPGGVMLITTPNATSVDVIARILKGEHPHLFDPHVRELAPKQIKAFSERVGFVVEAMGTFFAWGTADDATRSRILSFIADMGADPSNRGDDACFVLRKPWSAGMFHLATAGIGARKAAAYWRSEHHLGRVPDYEEVLRGVFERFLQPGDVVVDVGVNEGRHFKHFQQLTGPQGRVIGFEPVPDFISIATAAAGAESEIRQKAVSDAPGRGQFLFMTKAIGESGFVERASEQDRGAVPIDVEISTLDIELADLARLEYIKIDTEGHEISVIRGGVETIKRLRPLISVEWGQPTYSLYGHTRDSLYQLCEELDYRISDLFGNVVTDIDEWADVSDQSYWDFFLVPTEQLNRWNRLFEV